MVCLKCLQSSIHSDVTRRFFYNDNLNKLYCSSMYVPGCFLISYTLIDIDKGSLSEW